jgi:hypothetical protein
MKSDQGRQRAIKASSEEILEVYRATMGPFRPQNRVHCTNLTTDSNKGEPLKLGKYASALASKGMERIAQLAKQAEEKKCRSAYSEFDAFLYARLPITEEEVTQADLPSKMNKRAINREIIATVPLLDNPPGPPLKFAQTWTQQQLNPIHKNVMVAELILVRGLLRDQKLRQEESEAIVEAAMESEFGDPQSAATVLVGQFLSGRVSASAEFQAATGHESAPTTASTHGDDDGIPNLSLSLPLPLYLSLSLSLSLTLSHSLTKTQTHTHNHTHTQKNKH